MLIQTSFYKELIWYILSNIAGISISSLQCRLVADTGNSRRPANHSALLKAPHAPNKCSPQLPSP